MLKRGEIRLGGASDGGNVFLYPKQADIEQSTKLPTIRILGQKGIIQVPKITIDGEKGDILLENADLAEDFTIAEKPVAEPGMVMALSDDGLLRPATQAYDKRVVGVISGAGEFRPALVLDRQLNAKNRQPIAMVGKAYCRVTAEPAPIETGDLLTSSDLSGHAMKATDSSRAFGTVVGKVLEPLESGVGIVPVLVALQ